MENIETINIQLVCPSCHTPITEEEYFCPNCGKKLKDKPVSTGVAKQMLVYLVSFFLPPFGLPWAFRYLKQPDQKSKIIGYITIGLTIISILTNVWLIMAFINQTQQAMNTDFNNVFRPIYTQ